MTMKFLPSTARIALGLSVLGLLSACVSVGEVQPIGRDSYTVSVDVHGGEPAGEVRGHAIKRANEYCDSIGKHMLLTHTESGGVRGWTPQTATITFQCLAEDDPAYRRNTMRKEAGTVIRIEHEN